MTHSSSDCHSLTLNQVQHSLLNVQDFGVSDIDFIIKDLTACGRYIDCIGDHPPTEELACSCQPPTTGYPSPSDHLWVTFVCHHWHRVFLQFAQLWSWLYLTGEMNEHILKTFLEHAKQSHLDITLNYSVSSISNVGLLSPFTKQIENLIVYSVWQEDIDNLSAAISGPLSLLHTLHIEEC